MKFYRLLVLSFLFLMLNAPTQAQSNRADWFQDARYGMFIHWGLYSSAEGLWKGEKLRYLNNYAEWIRYRNRISKDEYGELAKRFVWEEIDTEEWVKLAKKSGMKYIIITTKHHDGVALWDTKVGEYSLPKLSGTNRDVIKEIAEACRKHDMKLGFYYSHWIDWEHPFAWDHNQELKGHVSDEQFNQYWQEKAIPQMRELLTNYGDVAMMWFDMWIPYQKSIFKKEQLEQAANLIRELQPNCLINSRLGLPTDAKYVDFQTLGDNVFGNSFTTHPWETPGTIAHSWGYSGQETEWKSTGQLFESLIGNVALNGGFTLNIGPRANGDVPFESVNRLENIGNWLGKYGEAIYGKTGLPLAGQHDWGKITFEKKTNTVYLNVFNWPLDKTLRLTGITSKPTKIELLNNRTTTDLSFTQSGPLTHIKLPSEQADPFVSVIRMRFDDVQLDEHAVVESTFGGYAMKGANALNTKELKIFKYDGKKPAHVKTSGQDITWEVYIAEPGTYKLDLSAHNPQKANMPVEVAVNGKTLAQQVKPDAMMVVEPNENNYVEEFVDRNIGEVRIDKAGPYKITFRAKGEQPLWFNYLWMEKKN